LSTSLISHVCFLDAGKYFEKLVIESGRVAGSILGSGRAGKLSPQMVFAVVCYTMDLRQFGAAENQNFFSLVNRALQKRDPVLLEGLQGYLYFFMSALHAMDPVPEKKFYRGIPKSNIKLVRSNYKSGVSAHWSGMSSVSENIEVAKGFAGKGGIIFHIQARTGRSIKVGQSSRRSNGTRCCIMARLIVSSL
jgi:hypothetical protein